MIFTPFAETDGRRRFVEQALAIRDVDAQEARSLGYTARILTIATLPHRRQVGDCYVRTNGGYRLIVQALPGAGLPFGSYPRLLLSWLATEIVRTRRRDLELGSSMAQFLRSLGLHTSGGKGCSDASGARPHSAGTIVRLRRQMVSLFGARFVLQHQSSAGDNIELLPIGESIQLWNEAKFLSGRFPSTLTVSERFYEHILRAPVPVDLRALRALKRSPLALDLYTWLTHRNFVLSTGGRAATFIPWSDLQVQFGADYPLDSRGKADFKKAFYAAFRRVQLVYRDARLRDSGPSLEVISAAPHVRPRKAD
jgi:hypothetical protein